MDFTKDICFDKNKIYENSELTIYYNGTLYQNNSDKVFISYGYGNLWDNKSEVELSKTDSGFSGTINIQTGNDLQFCFHDSNNNWDNNNNDNYIMPIFEKEKSEDLLKFEPIIESSKELDIEINNNNNTENITAPFKTITLSSEIIDIYETKDTKKNIAQNVIIPQEINLTNKIETNTKENILENTFIKEEKIISFETLKGTKENFVKAFDDNHITAGSVYVNSLIEDFEAKTETQSKIEIPKMPSEQPTFIEDITISTNTLIPTKEKSIEKKNVSKIYLLKKKIKISLYKFIKLIKTSLHYNEDKI